MGTERRLLLYDVNSAKSLDLNYKNYFILNVNKVEVC